MTSYYQPVPIAKVAAGVYFSGVLTKSGRIYLWGANASGQVCNGTFSASVNTPTFVSGVGATFVDFALGYKHGPAAPTSRGS